MGWREAGARYADGSTLATRPVEDVVARRVLDGMGFKQKDLPSLERALGITPDFDVAAWPRTHAVLRGMAALSGCRLIGAQKGLGMYEIEVLEVGGKHAEIMAMLDMLDLHMAPPHPLMLTRVKDSPLSLAYFVLNKLGTSADISMSSGIVTAPVNIIAETRNWWVACQETSHFIRQFGPYADPRQNA